MIRREVSMQRHEMIAHFRALGLRGMAGAFDDAVTTGLQKSRTVHEILTDLLRAETASREAASIRYRMNAAKLPAIEDLDDFEFAGTPINEGLVRSLHAGSFLPARRNIVAVGGTGTGKTHLALAIIASVVRAGARGASSTPSIWSTNSKKRPGSAKPERLLANWPGSTSSFSTNSATSRSP
jgi:DNA replication protein DnaC